MTTETRTIPSGAPSRTARALNFLHRAWIAELRVYSSIGRAIARRPAVPKGDTGIAYHQPVMTILIIFIVLSAVEIPILDLIVHPWPAVRIPILVLGIWGLTWMIGLFCAMLMRPHAVGPNGIRIRSGLELDVPVSWDDITSVAIVRRVDEPKLPRVTPIETAGEDGTEYAERMQDETNIEIELERPVSIRLPGLLPRGGRHEVARIRIWADDPHAFLAAARLFLVAAD